LLELKREGEFQRDGWSLSYYNDNKILDGQTSFRSEVASVEDPVGFDKAVSEILDTSRSISIAIGHLRTAASGAETIPDPHPFLFAYNGMCYSFILNGTFDREPFMQLLTENDKDTTWLKKYPPHTYGNGDWRNEGFTSIVATELYLSWIMKNIALCGNTLQGLATALLRVYDIIPSACSRNIIFSDGQRLYVSGGVDCLKYSTYVPPLTDTDPTPIVRHRAIMTEPPSIGPASKMNWTSVKDNQLVVLSQVSTETYSRDDLGTLSKGKNAISITNASYNDLDADGLIDHILIHADKGVSSENIKKMVDSNLIMLPPHMHSSDSDVMVVDSCSLSFAISPSDNANVAVEKENDEIYIRGTRFRDSNWLIGSQIRISDRVAPVIKSASVRNANFNSSVVQEKLLFVTFSEPTTILNGDTAVRPFTFLGFRGGSYIEFTPTFLACKSQKSCDSLVFKILSFNNPSIHNFLNNDFIRISATENCIGDTALPSNIQSSLNNVSRPIVVESSEPQPFKFFSSKGELFRFHAPVSGKITFTLYSLSGRCLKKTTIQVRKNQWVSLPTAVTNIRNYSASGIQLFSLSFGDLHTQGIINTLQYKNLELQVVD
jgi:hypothetical protein